MPGWRSGFRRTGLAANPDAGLGEDVEPAGRDREIGDVLHPRSRQQYRWQQQPGDGIQPGRPGRLQCGRRSGRAGSADPDQRPNNWGAGVWGTEAYWNNNIYSGGRTLEPRLYNGAGNSLTAYSFVNGVLSTTPTSQSPDQYTYPGPTPSVSANGATNGIVWALNNTRLNHGRPPMLSWPTMRPTLPIMLYSSNTNSARDSPGSPVEYHRPDDRQRQGLCRCGRRAEHLRIAGR